MNIQRDEYGEIELLGLDEYLSGVKQSYGTKQAEILKQISDSELKKNVEELWDKGKYTPMPDYDPAQVLISDSHTSVPQVVKKTCYICRDPEFAMMGLPLCKKCDRCGGHIPADDVYCDDCGEIDSEYEAYLNQREKENKNE